MLMLAINFYLLKLEYMEVHTHCFKNAKRLPAKYEANKNSWINTKLSEDYLTQLDRKFGAKNCKILLLIDQCTAHIKNTIFLRNIIPPTFRLACV
jgi:hypothetical protein